MQKINIETKLYKKYQSTIVFDRIGVEYNQGEGKYYVIMFLGGVEVNKEKLQNFINYIYSQLKNKQKVQSNYNDFKSNQNEEYNYNVLINQFKEERKNELNS